MNGYIAFFKGKQIEIYAPSLYAAKCEALVRLKVRKSQQGLLSVVLCELDGEQVIHSTSEI